MICSYIRSSSYNNYDYCQMQYFMTYVLGFQSQSGKKADLGTIVHKVMETLANLKKLSQDNPKEKKISFIDDAIGEVTTTVTALYKKPIVPLILEKSFNFYTNRSPHNSFTSSDRNTCLDMCWSALQFNNGQFDPRNRNIVQAEPHFDIPIEED